MVTTGAACVMNGHTLHEPPASAWRIALPHSAAAVPVARALVRTALAEREHTADSDTAELLTAELVANAVEHTGGGGPIELLLELEPGGGQHWAGARAVADERCGGVCVTDGGPAAVGVLVEGPAVQVSVELGEGVPGRQDPFTVAQVAVEAPQ